MAQPVIVQGLRILIVDIVGGILGFPVWWYSRGLAGWFRFIWNWFKDYQDVLGVSVWVKNIFVPMYGSYDIAGRIVSFFMRSAMIVLRSIALVLLGMLSIVLILLYLVLPIIITFMVVYHIVGAIL